MQPSIHSWTETPMCLTRHCWHPPMKTKTESEHLTENRAYLRFQVGVFKNSNISKIVQNYFANEGVPFESYCERCKNSLIRKDFNCLKRPTEGLVINLPRVNFNHVLQRMEKNATPVNLGDNIILGTTSYQLVSCVEHIGSPDSGFLLQTTECPKLTVFLISLDG